LPRLESNRSRTNTKLAQTRTWPTIHSQRRRLSSESAEFVKHCRARARLVPVPDLSCKLDPASVIEAFQERIRIIREQTCWIVVGRSRSLPLTPLSQCIFPACEGREPWNNLPKAALPGRSHRKAMCCCAVLESGCIEWLGGVRHGICHAVFWYSKSPSMPMSANKKGAESRNTCCLSHALAGPGGNTKHSPGSDSRKSAQSEEPGGMV
jgi:hypothetical protein